VGEDAGRAEGWRRGRRGVGPIPSGADAADAAVINGQGERAEVFTTSIAL
jgi:hypothetical protein